MQRIKVSNNINLDEFINPTTYERFGAKSQRYIRQELIVLLRRIPFYKYNIFNETNHACLIACGNCRFLCLVG